MYIVIEALPGFSNAVYSAASREFKIKRIIFLDAINGAMGFEVENSEKECAKKAKPFSLIFPGTVIGVLYSIDKDSPKFIVAYEAGKNLNDI